MTALGRPQDMPLLMNKVYASPEAGRAAARGVLDFAACRQCGFTWNRAFDASLVIYDEEYENDQAYSAAFRDHMQARAEDVIAAIPAGEPVDYLEVGCGQGRFIACIQDVAGGRVRSATGFDPAWRGADGEGASGSRLYRKYFEPATAALLPYPPNAVVTRHTIEHVPDPVGFLTTIRSALGPDSTARIWVETPCVSWILENRAMQDFFYEHCSLFTAESLAAALRKAGFKAPRVTHVFGGQYLWAEAFCGGEDNEPSLERPAEFDSLEGVRRDFIEHWQSELRAARKEGVVALWGAGAKGVSFSVLIDPDHDLIDHVVDINPAKQGFYLPGSGLSVLSPEESAKRNPGTIFVMNPNYIREVAETAREAGISGRLLPIE